MTEKDVEFFLDYSFYFCEKCPLLKTLNALCTFVPFLSNGMISQLDGFSGRHLNTAPALRTPG